MKISTIVFLGPPASGKGTQARLYGEEHSMPIISIGDLARAEVAKNSKLGKQFEIIINRGELIPDNLIIDTLHRHLDGLADNAAVILDGFPRTRNQAETLDSIARVIVAINISLTDEAVLHRITGRRVCPDGHLFNINTRPPQRDGRCDIDGKELQQRDDDTVEAASQRLAVYHKTADATIDYYREKNILLSVSGDPTVEAIAQSIVNGMKRYEDKIKR